MTPAQMKEWWVPLLRRFSRGERPKGKELAPAVRHAGLLDVDVIREYVADCLEGKHKGKRGKPWPTKEQRLLPVLWLAIDVRFLEAQYWLEGDKAHCRGRALTTIANGWRPSGRPAKPMKRGTLEDKITDMRGIPRLACLEPSLEVTKANLETAPGGDPDILRAKAERTLMLARRARKGDGKV